VLRLKLIYGLVGPYQLYAQLGPKFPDWRLPGGEHPVFHEGKREPCCVFSTHTMLGNPRHVRLRDGGEIAGVGPREIKMELNCPLWGSRESPSRSRSYPPVPLP
jgi:hypothetical protein